MSENCTEVWGKAHFEVKMYKTRQVRSAFWSSDVEKLHAALARSAFWSQIKKLRVREHFLKFWCRKIARRCVEKRIMKSKCKNPSGSDFWSCDVEKLHATLAKSTFWSQNVQKTSGSEKLHAAGAKSAFWSENAQNVSSGQFFEVLMSQNWMNLWREGNFVSQDVQNTCVSARFFKFRCRTISQVAS